jgi:ribonuclease HI
MCCDFMVEKIIAYTDGSYSPTFNLGGWGVVFIRTDGMEELCGCEYLPNNYVAELKAIVMALQNSSHHAKITIYTDAQPIVYTFHSSKAERKRILSKMKPINRRLWTDLRDLSHRRNVSLRWVRGHNGNECNMRADKLAKNAIKLSVEK